MSPRKALPSSNQSLVIRTDFSNDAAWHVVVSEVRQPVDGFYAYVDLVDDRAFDGLTVQELVEIGRDIPQSFAIVADRTTMESPERSLLIVDLLTEPGRTFRALPVHIQAIENNLSITNMDFREWADAADSDGVFRRYP
jgi:hypothetical protein